MESNLDNFWWKWQQATHFYQIFLFFSVKIKVKLIRYELMQTKTRKQTGTVAAETMPEGDADRPEQIPCASLHHGKDTSL